MEFLAHITKVDDRRIEQTCKEHAENVAQYAAEELAKVNLCNLGYIAGILHDMGKVKGEYLDYLERSYLGEKVIRGSVDHSSAGCCWILERFGITGQQDADKSFVDVLLSEIIAYAIASHHGVADCLTKDADSLYGRRMQAKKDISYSESVENFFDAVIKEKELDNLLSKAKKELESVLSDIKRSAQFQLGMLSRLVLSALTDADRIDTMEFMTQRKRQDIYEGFTDEQRKHLWKEQKDFFECKLEQMQSQAEDSGIIKVRKNISEQCARKAFEADGIYQLDVPTGGGKTLAALRYALTHAHEYNKKRIIFVIPLLTVLEQNSRVIRGYVKDENIILEHHSNVVLDSVNDEELQINDFLVDNWHSPIVITTMVQFLDTLFSSKMSAVRRMQALCDSIILIDEVQSVPKKMLNMFNVAMNFLHKVCRCSIVLSSATQPTYGVLKRPIAYSANAGMVTLTPEEQKEFKRTRIVNMVTSHGMTMNELTEFTMERIQGKSSVLVICNTKNTALRLLQQLSLRMSDEQCNLFHLSASMCPEHRTDVMKRLPDSSTYKEGRKTKTVCIATQVIEAGVDVSFECVIRVLAGIDNIAQAAGRCNRGNEYGYPCDVFLVNLNQSEESLRFLNDIKDAQKATLSLLELFKSSPNSFDNDLLSASSISAFYQRLYANQESRAYDYYVKEIQDTLYNLLADNSCRREFNYNEDNKWHNSIMNQSFKEAGTHFCVFDEDTIDVIVPYNSEAKNIISDLNSERAGHDIVFMEEVIRRAKKYTIHIFEYQRKKLDEMGMLHLYSDAGIYSLDEQCYHPKWGLDIEGEMIL